MSDKTEQPTPKRIRESREKGDICKSQDIPIALSVAGLTVYIILMGPHIFKQMVLMTEIPMHFMHKPFEEVVQICTQSVLDIMLGIIYPIVFFVMGVTTVSNIAQVGFLISLKSAMPKMENLSPSKWFKKTFSMKNLVEFLKNLIKVGVLGYAVWYVMEKNFRLLFTLHSGTVFDFWAILGSIIQELLIIASASFAVIAALDFLYQKWKYNKDHMMSKDEVKKEYKEMEGDPQIKGKRKQLHQELLTQNTMDTVKKSKVLVTNPTHFAIALDYEKDKTPLPIILAKGEGHIAQRMIEAAKEAGVPIMRNVPLARELFETGTENSYIPRNLIQPVAEVLRWVQTLSRH